MHYWKGFKWNERSSAGWRCRIAPTVIDEYTAYHCCGTSPETRLPPTAMVVQLLYSRQVEYIHMNITVRRRHRLIDSQSVIHLSSGGVGRGSGAGPTSNDLRYLWVLCKSGEFYRAGRVATDSVNTMRFLLAGCTLAFKTGFFELSNRLMTLRTPG